MDRYDEIPVVPLVGHPGVILVQERIGDAMRVAVFILFCCRLMSSPMSKCSAALDVSESEIPR